eukprot:TRINITY_DN53229_c0_g1_i1.p1 TRINITY_DN53229_c0_g1~~TRINITY_DN53229_c0_g1_i1.p1  ORF type:complete len:278 (+),score=59.96 TRINITY_DN53229_c0_g1_i1:66-899(+)
MSEQKDAGEKEEALMSFQFTVPENVSTGVTLKVQAPDGVSLNIPLPANILGGDTMVMQRAADGKWGIKHVIRGEPVPSVEPTSNGGKRSDAQLAADLEESNVQVATLNTTKGPIKVRISPMWAPKGSTRFLQLVTDKYYTDIAIYRAVPEFLVQFGVIDDERRNKYEAIADDALVGVPVKEGMVCFAASGANTRCATLCIFLGDYPQLGENPWETPIGRVCEESMPVLRSLHVGYGDMPQCGGNGPDPIELQDRGNSYIKEKFPDCDFVESATWDTA